jgi:hypothetical protein
MADTPSNGRRLNKALRPSQIEMRGIRRLTGLNNKNAAANSFELAAAGSVGVSKKLRLRLGRDDFDLQVADAFDFAFDFVAGI